MSEVAAPWISKPVKNAAQVHRMRGWRDFFEFIETHVFSASRDRQPSLVWRGQRDSRWKLETSLDRLFRSLKLDVEVDDDGLEKRSLELAKAFRHAARGRRGVNPKDLSPNEWWALGQHHGLATPLLDWTRSPFAALYFAFEEPSPPDQGDFRLVYALDEELVDDANAVINESPTEGFVPTLTLIDPLADDNPRLVSQGGVFTRGPVGLPIEDWVDRFASDGSNEPVLLRIEIPNSDRIDCLRGLDRMNINHLSLFPDLSGAARCVNLRAELAARRLK